MGERNYHETRPLFSSFDGDRQKRRSFSTDGRHGAGGSPLREHGKREGPAALNVVTPFWCEKTSHAMPRFLAALGFLLAKRDALQGLNIFS